jgi:ribonuclease D
VDYARLDTHYLIALRDRQLDALTATGRWPEAREEFERLAAQRGERADTEPEPSAFWRVKGARELSPVQAGVLRALFAYREEQAQRIDRPPFKVMSEATLLELARTAPRRAADLRGLSPEQMRRYAEGVLQAIEQGLRAPAPAPPPIEREPEEVRDRYDRLHTWRKDTARARGVESDVILPRTALRDLARRPPRTLADLAEIPDFGPWRRSMYGNEILALLSAPAPTSDRD